MIQGVGARYPLNFFHEPCTTTINDISLSRKPYFPLEDRINKTALKLLKSRVGMGTVFFIFFPYFGKVDKLTLMNWTFSSFSGFQFHINRVGGGNRAS